MKNTFNSKIVINFQRPKGFALPTVLIASLIMLSVLVASVSSTVSIRSALVAQYYNQLAQNASDAGVAYAKACLEISSGVPKWNNVNKLTSSTDCSGIQLSGVTCPGNSLCQVASIDNVISNFSVGLSSDDIGADGKITTIRSVGTANLVRTSNGTVWKTYSQNSIFKIATKGITTDGLTLNLDAGNSNSYPGSATKNLCSVSVQTEWTDLTCGMRSGILNNGVTYLTDNGGSLVFDGSDDFVRVGYLGDFPSQGSISFWMKPSTVGTSKSVLTTRYNGKNRGIRFATSANNFDVIIGDDSADVTTTNSQTRSYLSGAMTSGIWYHITFVWDRTNNNIKGYLNGSLVSGFNVANTYWPSKIDDIAIGTSWDTTNTYLWNGEIPMVQIYNRALSPVDVMQNYNAYKSRYQ